MSLTFEHTRVRGFETAFRAARNPYDSWNKSDSTFSDYGVCLGPNDMALAKKLILAGDEHATFLRMVQCWVDITGPRLWWTEMDRYRIGKEQISCSTMHRIMSKPFTASDFEDGLWVGAVDQLNAARNLYLVEKDPDKKKQIWRAVIDNLPQSYRQKRTAMMSYQTIRKICRERKGHKLVEWQDFINWAEILPEHWMIFTRRVEDKSNDRIQIRVPHAAPSTRSNPV